MSVSSLAFQAVSPSPPVWDCHDNRSPLSAALLSGVATQVKVYVGMLNGVTLWDSGCTLTFNWLESFRIQVVQKGHLLYLLKFEPDSSNASMSNSFLC